MTRFVEVKLAGAGPGVLAATEAPPGGDGRVEILLKNGRSLRVGRGFDAEVVRALVAVVRERGMRGLPSLRTLDEDAAGCAPRVRLWLASEATDMRCGFDRLAERVSAVIGQDPLEVATGSFFARGGADRLKILTWDRDGFIFCGTIQPSSHYTSFSSSWVILEVLAARLLLSIH